MPSTAASTLPTDSVLPASIARVRSGREERSDDADAEDDERQQQEDLGHLVEEERHRAAEVRGRREPQHIVHEPGRAPLDEPVRHHPGHQGDRDDERQGHPGPRRRGGCGGTELAHRPDPSTAAVRAPVGLGNQWRVRLQNEHTESITGTSTSTPDHRRQCRARARPEQRDRHRDRELEEVAGADQGTGCRDVVRDAEPPHQPVGERRVEVDLDQDRDRDQEHVEPAPGDVVRLEGEDEHQRGEQRERRDGVEERQERAFEPISALRAQAAPRG